MKDELHENFGTSIDYGRLYLNLDPLVEKGEYDDRTNADSLTRRGHR